MPPALLAVVRRETPPKAPLGSGRTKEWIMRTTFKMIPVTVALVLAAASAWAADACFKDGLNDATMIMKSFKFPNPGDCKPINGYESGNDCLITGTACGTPDGLQVRFVMRYVCMTAGGFGDLWFSTDRTYFQGDGFSCYQDLSTGGWTCPSFPVWKVSCPITLPATGIIRPPVVGLAP
jgi:hypothetical protein